MINVEHVVEGAGGRRLRVVERGAEGGTVVLVHHGTPSSGSLWPGHVEMAAARGARMIAYDRPGYGGSDEHRGRTVSCAVRDVQAIADHLGAERLVTWGASGGGPHALACVALLGDRVAAAAAVACVAPAEADGLQFLAGMGEENVEEFGHAVEGRAALEPYLCEMTSQLLASNPGDVAQIMQTILSPVDREVFSGALAEHIVGGMHAGLAPGPEGWIEDDLAFVADWGFCVEDIRAPVLLMQGEQDLMVPADHGRWLAGRIDGVDAHVLPDEGHLTIIQRRMPEILDWLLAKL